MFSYLGDLSQDDSSVLPALSQSLHGSQELFPVLDFLHYCRGEGLSVHKAVGVPRGPWGKVGVLCPGLLLLAPSNSVHARHPPPPPLQPGLRSSNRSGSGAGSSCCTGGAFLFCFSGSFPVAKIFWSLRFSFSRSPVEPNSGIAKVEREPCSWFLLGWHAVVSA